MGGSPLWVHGSLCTLPHRSSHLSDPARCTLDRAGAGRARSLVSFSAWVHLGLDGALHLVNEHVDDLVALSARKTFELSRPVR